MLSVLQPVTPVNNLLNLEGRLFDLSIPRVMGILNVTPDSFFDGGIFTDERSQLAKVEKMLLDQASFIDIGGYSSRPQSGDVPQAEELRRVLPALRAIKKTFPQALLSIDTFRSEVAKAAVAEGASMVNDIGGGTLDPRMMATVASLKVPYILMHMRGTPQTMTQLTGYTNVTLEVIHELQKQIHAATAAGIRDIIVDPGFGFAKTAEQNFELLHHLRSLASLGKPVLAGLSRKSMIWKSLNTTPEGALHGTTSLNTIALLNGASILRVHDVKEAHDAIVLYRKYARATA